MSKVRNGVMLFLALTLLLLTTLSCSKDDPAPSKPKDVKTAILIYVVASNNLESSFHEDVEEMLDGAKNVNLNEADVIIYSVERTGNAKLRRIVKDNIGTPALSLIKEYDRSTFSTDPERISEVINDFTALDNADHRGLILWSHASGWEPEFSDHIVPVANYSFGEDHYNGKSDYCDIIELNNAIPTGVFDYIWFDCCYMAQIESLYQMRDKADYFIGSPMEMAGEGNPYNIVLPLLARPDYDLKGAVESVARYFINRNIPIAISLIDASYLPDAAAFACRAFTGKRPSTLGLTSYNRTPISSLYDYLQFTDKYGSSLPKGWHPESFRNFIDCLVPCRYTGGRNWNNRPIDETSFSGVAIHNYQDLEDPTSDYYKQLDWYQDAHIFK